MGCSHSSRGDVVPEQDAHMTKAGWTAATLKRPGSMMIDPMGVQARPIAHDARVRLGQTLKPSSWSGHGSRKLGRLGMHRVGSENRATSKRGMHGELRLPDRMPTIASFRAASMIDRDMEAAASGLPLPSNPRMKVQRVVRMGSGVNMHHLTAPITASVDDMEQGEHATAADYANSGVAAGLPESPRTPPSNPSFEASTGAGGAGAGSNESSPIVKIGQSLRSIGQKSQAVVAKMRSPASRNKVKSFSGAAIQPQRRSNDLRVTNRQRTGSDTYETQIPLGSVRDMVFKASSRQLGLSRRDLSLAMGPAVKAAPVAMPRVRGSFGPSSKTLSFVSAQGKPTPLQSAKLWRGGEDESSNFTSAVLSR